MLYSVFYEHLLCVRFSIDIEERMANKTDGPACGWKVKMVPGERSG
jgi:hypothetical protein